MTINISTLHNKYGYLEPMPTNQLLIEQMGHGMVVFTITGLMSIVFCLISILMLVVYRKKVCRRTHIRMILSLMIVSDGANGLYLVLDPYGLRACLPFFLVNTIEQCFKSTVILEFFVLQNYLICSTRMAAKWNKFKSTKHMTRLLLFYLSSIMIIESICIFTDFKDVLRFIYKTFTIILLLYSAGCFLSTAFQTCLYFDRIRPFRSDNGHRNSTNYETDSAVSVNVRGQSRPATNRDQKRENLIEDTTSFLDCKKESPLNDCSDSSWSSDDVRPEKSRDYDAIGAIDTETRVNVFKAEVTTMKANKSDKLSEYFYENNDEQNNSQEERTQMIEKVNELSTLANGVNTGSFEIIATINDGDMKGQPNINYTQGIEVDRQQAFNDDIFSLENGYLADMDTISNYTFASSLRTSDNEISEVWKRANPNNNDSNEKEPKEMTFPYSLVRIRQSYTLQKVVSIGYFIAFSFVVDVVFQMFSIFELYGIWGTGKAPRPWPWFLFQISHRMVTMTTCLLLLVAVFYALRNRNKHKRVSRLRLSSIATSL